MAGHSKWKNNLGRKTAQDAKKSANFGKLSKAITVAVLEGGSPDPNFNPRLRMAVDAARSGSMPKDNIERAIAKGSGPDKATLATAIYEIFGPHGTMMVVTATTDNLNRTTNEMRALIDRNGAKLGGHGSVRHLFEHLGVCEVGKEGGKLADDEVLTISTILDATDYTMLDDGHAIIYFHFDHIGKAKHMLEEHGFKVYDGPNAIYKATMPIALDEKAIGDCDRLIEALEAHDDVHEVFSNIK
jgi:YebC/PmpR family DNA-binding regulatory protein